MRFLGLAALAGCQGVWGDGTQTGTEVPDYCAETGRAEVDPAVAIDALGFAPREVIEANAGTWVGPFTSPYAAATDATLALNDTGAPAVHVTYTLVTRPDDGTADMDPSFDTTCPGRVEVALDAALATADGALDEAFTARLLASSADAGAFTAWLPLASVGGTARPTAFDPTEWDGTDLAIDAWRNRDTATWEGSALWQAYDDPPEPADDTGGSGTIEPSGMSETVGSFALTRG